METTIEHPKYGKLTYRESFWTGAKTLFCDGKPCKKMNRRTFVMPDGVPGVVKGGGWISAKLLIGGETVQLTTPFKWYEIVIAILPFLFDIVWGNIPSLVVIFPIVGGAIGGFVGALGACLSLLAMRAVKKWWQKVLIGIVIGAAAIGICYLIALAILSAAA